MEKYDGGYDDYVVEEIKKKRKKKDVNVLNIYINKKKKKK